MSKRASQTRVVNVRTDEFDVYIGRAVSRAKDPRCKRASIWANPFKADDKTTAKMAVSRYRKYVAKLLRDDPKLRQELKKLKGKRLGCWCKPGPCHGDVLVELMGTEI